MTDDSIEDELWCAEHRQNVLGYLAGEGCPSTSVGEWPAWHVSPLLSIWAVESVKKPGWVGWWAVSGDCPTDYVECGPDRHPRQGLRDIGMRWQEAARLWLSGQEVADFKIGDGSNHTELAELLAKRATMVLNIAGNDDYWTE